MLQQNIGTIDRALRTVVGVVLLLMIAVGPRTFWGLLGVIPLTTAILGVCPLYTLLGVKSCPGP